MAPSPYAPPIAPASARLAIIAWYRAYAALMACFYVALAILFAFSVGESARWLASIVAIVFAAFFAIAACIPRKPWGWTLGAAAIAVGLASITILVAVPLFVVWRKPTTRAAFQLLP
jgi:hypothetical protein